MELETAASTIEVTDSGVSIRWSDGSRSRFHSLWLRDNCPSGGAKGTVTRTFSLTELNADLFVLIAEYDDNGDLLVEFSDGHESVFAFDWLRANSYEPHDRLGKVRTISNFRAGHEVVSFDLPTFASASHCDLLDAVAEWGAAIVDDVPDHEQGTEAVVALFGPSRETGDGRLRDIIAEPEDFVSTDAGLAFDPQTVESYRYMPAGIMVLHCVEANSTGGDVVLVDGFDIASDLQDEDPDVFDALTQIRVPFVRHTSSESGESDHFLAHGPVISLDRDYQISGIRFDECSLAPLDVDPPQVDDYLRALITFTKAVNDPGRAVQVRLRPGQALVFDNHRVLHGRTGFIADGGRRHMRLGAVDRDQFHSRIRQLRETLGRTSADARLPGGATS